MAIDSRGRMYVSTGAGVQIFADKGRYLGVEEDGGAMGTTPTGRIPGLTRNALLSELRIRAPLRVQLRLLDHRDVLGSSKALRRVVPRHTPFLPSGWDSVEAVLLGSRHSRGTGGVEVGHEVAGSHAVFAGQCAFAYRSCDTRSGNTPCYFEAVVYRTRGSSTWRAASLLAIHSVSSGRLASCAVLRVSNFWKSCFSVSRKVVGAKWVQNRGDYRKKVAGARAKGNRISET